MHSTYVSTTLTEYVCEDCGTLLRHSNPITLESMRDVHNQLCIVKRQKTAAVAKPAPAAAAPKATPAAASVATPAMEAPPVPPAAGGGATTISLSGTGTNYSKVDGPINAKF